MLDLESVNNFKYETWLEFSLSCTVARASLTSIIFRRKMIFLLPVFSLL